MKFSEINFEFVKNYLNVSDEDEAEINVYLVAAKSYVMKYTGLTPLQLDENEYFVMPTLMLTSSFFENKTVEMSNKISTIYKDMLNLDKVLSLW